MEKFLQKTSLADPCRFFFLILGTALLGFSNSVFAANLISLSGNIDMDADDNGRPEVTINSTGLGIGAIPTSANLEVNGNTIFTKSLNVGGPQGSANLNFTGVLGYHLQNINASAVLEGHQVYKADSSNDDLRLTLPTASSVEGQRFVIKKTSWSNNVFIKGEGLFMVSLKEAYEMGCLTAVSSNGNWHTLGLFGDGDTSISSSNLIGWWKLNETKGTSVSDSSPTGNDGNVTNTTLDASSTSGKWHEALDLGGTNEHISIPYSTAYEMDQLTVAIWAYPNTTGTNLQLFTKDQTSGGTNQVWQLRKNTDETISFIVYNESGTPISTTSTRTMTVNSWNHVAGTWDGSDLKVYLNGLLEDTTSSSGKLNKSQTNKIFLGRSEHASPEYFDGRLEQAILFDQALTEDEIRLLAR
jgi:hypothetical protein